MAHKFETQEAVRMGSRIIGLEAKVREARHRYLSAGNVPNWQELRAELYSAYDEFTDAVAEVCNAAVKNNGCTCKETNVE
jgi:hypothetical protein